MQENNTQFDKKMSDSLVDNKLYAEYYDYAANYYAQIKNYDSYAYMLARENSDRLFNFFPAPVSMTSIVDFGCGNGLILKFLAQKFYPKMALGIDISHFQLTLARKDFPEGHYVVGDEKVLESIPEPVDLILLNDILEHLREPQKILTIARTKTKYIGIVQILEKTRWRKFLSWLTLKEMKSRYYESLGHLYIWDKSDFFSLLKESNLKIETFKITNYTNSLLFHDYVIEQLKNKKGMLIVLKYWIYNFLKILPARFTNWILTEISGNFIYCLCKTNHNEQCD